MPALFPHHPLTLLDNPHATPDAPYGDDLRQVLNHDAAHQARAEIATWPGYATTPLVALDGLARAAGVGAIRYKDEGGRFGLGSFKALGGAYAVLRLLQRQVVAHTGGEPPTSRALAAGEHVAVCGALTVTCATDGNHGRSVAWGAQLFGCRCVIYIHEHVSAGRERAIAQYGAEVRRVPGTYDDAVRQADADATAQGWHVVSDTSYPGYMDVPRDVMQGYTVMVQEAMEQWPGGSRPTHAFVQGGVGGLAAAVCAHLWEAWGADRPRLVVAEPERAACLTASAAAGRATAVGGELDTIMAGLACGEPSLVAWQVLQPGAAHFATLPDEAAEDAMRLLAAPPYGDPPLVAGESAVAGLAALLLAVQDPALRARLGLDAESTVLLIGSEGATDPDLYTSIVGQRPEEVAS